MSSSLDEIATLTPARDTVAEQHFSPFERPWRGRITFAGPWCQTMVTSRPSWCFPRRLPDLYRRSCVAVSDAGTDWLKLRTADSRFLSHEFTRLRSPGTQSFVAPPRPRPSAGRLPLRRASARMIVSVFWHILTRDGTGFFGAPVSVRVA